MPQVFPSGWNISLFAFSYLLVINPKLLAQQRDLTWRGDLAVTLAQVTSDGTVNTQVNQNGNVAEITGGETRGGNLFHSFQDFSVGTGNEAFFNNANDISNIFSRVTGGNISNIDGLIRANGSASLFLINPAGIIFGENARLDLGGSFYGSTASSILFEGGEFSAADLENPPLLTINAPIGLGFRDNPGDITVQGISTESELITPENVLRVDSGKNFSLVGGNINLNGGKIVAPGGRVELGGLLVAGDIEINVDGSLNFPTEIERADVTLTDFASVNVTAGEGGFINVNTKNLILSGQSELFAGIAENMGSPDAQAGDITIDATESIQLTGSGGNSFDKEIDDLDTAIRNHVGLPPQIGSNDFNTESPRNPELASTALGNAGSIIIQTNRLEIRDRAALTAKIYGQGDTGNITVTANEIVLDGGDFLNQVREGGRGNTGNINVDTESLSAQNSSFIISDIEGEGKGNAGDIEINTVNFSLQDGASIFADTLGTGNTGNITINATETAILEDASISNRVGENAEGNAGNVVINTTDFSLQEGASIFADTFGTGNAGNITINANSQIVLENSSAVSSRVRNFGEGNAGDINIDTDILSLTNESEIRADTESNENAGNITVIARKLNVGDGAQIGTGTSGGGNAGNLTVDASESIQLAGQSEARRSGLIANAIESSGQGGNLIVNTNELSIKDGAIITVGNFQTLNTNQPGTGEPGEITIEANSINLDTGGRIEAATQSEFGEGANINLQVAEDITLRDNSLISAQAFNNANGGNLNIDSRFIIAFPDGNNDIIASAQQGMGGNININAESLFGIQERPLSDSTNDINASSEFSLDGNVTINTPDINPVQGATELPANIVQPEQTSQQACQSNREIAAQNGLSITGKGGIPPAPDLPLDSHTISVNGETNTTFTTPKPIETSQGKIQPARGIKVTESGEIILTAYRTNNAGDRIPESSANCDRR